MQESHAALSELRTLLHNDRTQDTWAHVCAALDRLGTDDVLSVAIPYVLEHTLGWPKGVRLAPPRWIEAEDPRLAVVDSVSLRGWASGRIEALWTHPTFPLETVDSLEGVAMDEVVGLLRKRGFAKRCKALRHITLTRAPSRSRGFAEALRAPGWKAFSSVRLRDYFGDVFPLYHLSSSTAFNNVTHLYASGAGIEGEDPRNWQFVKMRKLQYVDVSDNMGRVGPLARSAACKTIVTIDGRNQDPCGAVEVGYFKACAYEFATSKYTGSLRALHLTPSEIGPEGIRVIAESTRLHEDVKRPYREMLGVEF